MSIKDQINQKHNKTDDTGWPLAPNLLDLGLIFVLKSHILYKTPEYEHP